MKKNPGSSTHGFSTKKEKKCANKKQVPVASMQVVNRSFGQDVQSGSQATDLNGLEEVMDILVDISSHLKVDRDRDGRSESREGHHQDPEPFY